MCFVLYHIAVPDRLEEKKKIEKKSDLASGLLEREFAFDRMSGGKLTTRMDKTTCLLFGGIWSWEGSL